MSAMLEPTRNLADGNTCDQRRGQPNQGDFRDALQRRHADGADHTRRGVRADGVAVARADSGDDQEDGREEVDGSLANLGGNRLLHTQGVSSLRIRAAVVVATDHDDGADGKRERQPRAKDT